MKPRDGAPFWLCFVVAMPISIVSMFVWHHIGELHAVVVMIVLSLAGGITLAELRS